MRILAVVVVSLFLMLLSLGIAGGGDMFSFLNADTMFFYMLYNDLFVWGNSLLGWDLNTTFNLMPNALLYFPVLMLVNHPVWGQILHGLLQHLLFIWAAWYMLTSLRPRPSNALIGASLLLVAWFFLNAIQQGNFFLAGMFYHPYHFGALIMGCFMMGLNQRWLRRPSGGLLAAILVVGSLSAFSNRIFLVLFTFPWLLTLGVMWMMARRNGRILGRNALINAGAALLGFLLFRGLANVRGIWFASTFMFNWENIGPSFLIMYSTWRDYIIRSPLLGGMIVLGAVVYVWGGVLLIKNNKLKNSLQEGNGQEEHGIFHFSFFIFNLLFVPLVWLMPVINGMVFTMAETRYNFMIIVWMLLGMAPLLQLLQGRKAAGDDGRKWRVGLQQAFFVVVLLATLGTGMWLGRGTRPVEGIRELTDYYPGRAAAIDRVAEQYGLKGGISDYWDAKPLTAFSRKGLRVVQVHPDLRPYYLAGSRNWYFPYAGNAEQPVFNFIIHFPEIIPERLTEVFGNQIDTLVLENCTLLLVPEFVFLRDRNLRVIEDSFSTDEL